jgi:hypothetical protein
VSVIAETETVRDVGDRGSRRDDQPVGAIEPAMEGVVADRLTLEATEGAG